MTTQNHDWVSLVGMSGLLVSEPVLADAFPDGPPALDQRTQRRFRTEWNRWLASDKAEDNRPLYRWADFILEELLGHGFNAFHKYPAISEKLVVELGEYEQKLWPDRVLPGEDGEAQMLIRVVSRGQGLDRQETETGRWRASPFTKLVRLLRDTRVPIGILTNGDQWRLVYADAGLPTTSYLEWTAQSWHDERMTLDAVAMLLGAARFDPENPDVSLLALARESQNRQADVADQLGDQVRAGLRALVRALDRADRATEGEILRGMSLDQIYEMAMTVMMRLVFLLYAEENALLPHGQVLYDRAYGLTYLWTRLQRQRREDRESLDQTHDAWPQLLAAFRLVHDGVDHPDFALPAYGGWLFDPDRFPALEHPRLNISNRAIYDMLRRLLLAEGQIGRERVTQRVSYRALDVEQLGYVYEGLLGYTLREADKTLLTYHGKGNPQRPLTEFEEASTDQDGLYEYIKSVCDVHWATIKRAVEEAWESPSPQGASLYEQLAPFADVIDLDEIVESGDLIVIQSPGTRKRTGTYYTPTQITSFLVKQAMEPLCYYNEEEGGGIKPPADILALKVCDPAMGSGAFLVQACRYLAERLVESWELIEVEQPSVPLIMPYAQPSDTSPGEMLLPSDRDDRLAWAKRFVAERCLYGVDLNPLAVELAKLSLWLVTLSKDKPFTFLDHRLRQGNSLIGAPLLAETTLEHNGVERTVRQIDFIPNEALNPRKGASKEEREAARERQKQNQKALQAIAAGQLFLGGEYDVSEALAHLRQQQRKLTAQPTMFADDYDVKEQVLAQIHKEGFYPQFKALCDLWCAVWFWDEKRYGPAPTSREYIEYAHAVVTSALGVARLGSFILAEERLSEFGNTVKEIAREQAFFHWELEFPDVHGREQSGFDAVISNPPWEVILPNLQEFFEAYDPLIREYTIQEAREVADALMEEEDEIATSWISYQAALVHQHNLFKSETIYRSQGQGTVNTYKLFLERSYGLLSGGAYVSLVLPSGIYTDRGSVELRQLLLDHMRISGLFAFENRQLVFPIDSRFRFALLTAQRDGPTETFRAAFMRQHLTDLADIQETALLIDRSLVQRFSPDTLSIMEFQSQLELDLLVTLFDEHPLLGEEVTDCWNVRFRREFHMTDDGHLFNTDAVGLPLYEGRMIHQFDAYYSPPSYWVDETEGRAATLQDEGAPYENYRLGFRKIARNTDERTLISAIVPRFNFLSESITYCVSQDITPQGLLFLMASLNSFVVDFVIRTKVSATLNMFYVYQLPIPRLRQGNAYFDAIVPRASSLSCTSESLADLWTEVIGQPWHPEDGATDPAERQRLRDELDALVAHLYGLSRDDFNHILGTFPLVFPDTEEGWAKREALLAVYDEFAPKVRGWPRG